ncbi:MAG: MerR family transcriptional regulator [Hyphomicrobiales bacterium]|nr:MerR family transcriptional regulator [Hyphomicrobiales bacterium]
MTTQTPGKLRDHNGTCEAAPSSAPCTISEMAVEFGVSLRTLRFYEDRHLLRPLRRGTARLYSATDRARLRMILKAKELGFTLSEISDLMADTPEGATSLDLNLRPEQILVQISLLERQRRGLEHAIGELRATHARLAEVGAGVQVA